MKAAFVKEPGGPEKIEYGDLPDPKPGPGEVLVRVRACALNHVDIWVRNGIPAYRTKFPHILGSDIAGDIAESSDPRLKIGTPVFVNPAIACGRCPPCLAGRDNQCETFKILGAMTPGGYAELVAVPAANVFPKPDFLSYEEAAAFPLTFITAWHMLMTRAVLKAGERVLVLGASSGVGSAAIQIAKAAGAEVLAVSSTDEKLARAKEQGADHLINGRKEVISGRVHEITGGRGVEVVFEHVGPATWEQSIKSMAPYGRLVTCGSTTGPTVQLDMRYVFSRNLSILGSRMGTRADFGKVSEMIGKRKLKPVVGKVFPLTEARRAHEYLERQEQFGKVVLKVG